MWPGQARKAGSSTRLQGHFAVDIFLMSSDLFLQVQSLHQSCRMKDSGMADGAKIKRAKPNEDRLVALAPPQHRTSPPLSLQPAPMPFHRVPSTPQQSLVHTLFSAVHVCTKRLFALCCAVPFQKKHSFHHLFLPCTGAGLWSRWFLAQHDAALAGDACWEKKTQGKLYWRFLSMGSIFAVAFCFVARRFQEMSQWRQKCQRGRDENTRRWIGLSWIESSVRIFSPAGQCSARIYCNILQFISFQIICQSMSESIHVPSQALFHVFVFTNMTWNSAGPKV